MSDAVRAGGQPADPHVFFDALRDDLATLAAGFADAVTATAPGCWALRLPLPHACARLGLVHPAGAGSPEAALAFVADTFPEGGAVVWIALDAAGAADHDTAAAFRAAGWTVSAPQPYLQLTAADVPAWDDALRTKVLATPRDVRRAHAIVAAAAAWEGVADPALDETLRYARTHPEHTIYGAMADDRMVATVHTVHRGQHCGLYLVATDPAEQRKGYGGMLLDQVLYLERERGAMQFRVVPAPGAAALFETAGFHAVGRMVIATRV